MLNITNTDTDFMRKFKGYLMSLDYCGNEYDFEQPDTVEELLDQEYRRFWCELGYPNSDIHRPNKWPAFEYFINGLSGVFTPEWLLAPCFDVLCELLECSPAEKEQLAGKLGDFKERKAEEIFTRLTFKAIKGEHDRREKERREKYIIV